HTAMRFFPDPASKEYGAVEEPIHIVCKVETHNHPTAVSPFPGAATGVGGEIRDEGATGIGGKPKAGLTGFSVSHLLLPGAEQPWEDRTIGKPNRIASALQIMLDAPIGGARFNNEFGRPNVCGYFRSFLQDVGGQVKGYHKPIMLAGGLGNIRDQHLFKKKVGPGCHIVVLGGPAMLIGLGGGAASSMAQGASAEDVDFASVQRDNAELERRCQEVIDRCWELGDHNPILCIHDVGAGGLSNAIPEVLHDSGNGGIIHLRKVPNTEPGMSPMEVWCNEAQERYVIACNTEGLASLEAICQRERCIYAVVGETTAEQRLIVDDSLFGNTPVDLSMGTLFGKPPRVSKTVTATKPSIAELSVSASADEALHRVLANPTVASKSFLITIGDRTVTGLIARDQMVGKWQVPVADVAVTCSGYEGFTGEAMSCGERAPVAVIDGPSSAGLAIGEAITNILAADVRSLKDVRFSANWMVNSGSNEEDYSLYKTCEKIGMDLAPKLGICIPVGKDSMSMKSIWTDEKGTQKKVTAPLSVVITGFAPVTDVRKTWTPDLKRTGEETVLLLVQLGGENKRRLGGSVLAQTYSTMGNEAPCMGSTDHILAFAAATTTLRDQNLVLAYHDRSDGGWIVSVAEMCFAGRQGASISVQTDASVLAELFNEELGVVLQVSKANEAAVRDTLTTAGLPQDAVVTLGGVTKEQVLTVSVNGTEVIKRTRAELQRVWAEVSYRMQSLRDNAECAEQEYAAILDDEDPGLHCDLPFSIPKPIPVSAGAPRVAILREQGVNGHFEMANAFHTAGFVVADVHMSDILSGAA
ncbi:Phosphoribosylformylglycinamidine synthase, partial [Diplonema papillatum]